MLALALFLAQTSAPPPVSGDWQSNFVSLGIMILIAVTVWEKLKRKPALEETFANKKHSEEAERRIELEIKTLDERTRLEIGALDTRTQQSIRAMNELGERRAKDNRDLIQEKIAALEKSIGEKIHDNRENNSEKFAAIFAKLDAHQMSMQGLSSDVMFQIGKLDGQLNERPAT